MIQVAYAQIDWHDFVVVETVDYQIGEIGNFPPPTTPEEVGARVLMQDRQAQKKNKDDDQEAGKDEDEMQMDSDDEMLDRTGKKGADNMESSSDESEGDIVRKTEETKSREGKDNTQVSELLYNIFFNISYVLVLLRKSVLRLYVICAHK